ncbi:LPXTG-motif cell wall anchor domain protein [Brevibacterium mcbrellneri ATCC 49030]|uniref:LPXTG-motif cell wall anchor domain protein n=1 Tax=Brevibacterium mcbrellneri ATCC 49030 TaxID=585530 RepID=D4YL59_9MICO|nr:LPXTG-motif cell wall anchor domain protein [Brevibacterium mcbrellneri ATCC 49030]
MLAPAVAAAVTGMIAAPAVATSTSPEPQHDPTSDDASEASRQSSEIKVSVADTTVSVADITNADKGVTFKGENFKPNTTARVFVTGPNDQQYPANTELSVNDKGEVNGTYYFTVEEGAEVPLGQYSLALRSVQEEKTTDPATFNVTADGEEPAPEPTPEAPKETQTPKPEPTPTPTETPEPTPTPTETPEPTPTPEKTQTAEPTPTPTETPAPTPKETQTPKPEPTPTPTETPAPTPEPTETPEPTPTPEKTQTPEAPVSDASLSISPSEISAEDFSDKNKGVNATVTGLKAGSKYTFKFEHSEGKTSAYEVTKTADDKGVATAGVAAGEGSKVHPGKYTVKVTGDELDKPLTGSFTVRPPKDDEAGDGGQSSEIDNSQDGQGDSPEGEQDNSEDSATPPTNEKSNDDANTTESDESTDSGESKESTDTSRRPAEERAPRHGENATAPESSNDLPRTGTELTGLALGVGLIVVGGAAVVVTRRKASTDGTF